MAVASKPAIVPASARERRTSFRVRAMMGWWHPQESWDEAAICEKQNWRWNELTANTQDATA
eukprot:CAMPEP_0183542102 /NCGR_PEP_ID=MMETSP0371-20130417/41678_1 /TAXON_ID=268820 /ORGANISM="Peridinium aciculiferum, Strain PAER-2" /LENGTH=61 /DNA_ID=CAMNT_0025743287 /DNA_START=13 /DNA_END=195 /DNA_ORIENTATION=+